MGETLSTLNPGVLLLFLFGFALIILARGNWFNKINLLVYILYSVGFVLTQKYIGYSLFQGILLHFVVSVTHLLFVFGFNLMITKVRK